MSLYKKLLEIKKKVPYIQKDKLKAPKGLQYSYASPDAVLGTLNPLLNEAGIFLKTEIIKSTSTRIFEKQKGIDIYLNNEKSGVIVDVHETLFDLDLRFTWIDTETDEKEECLFSSSGVNGDEKGLGSALTYAERYFLLKTFNIPTGDDDPDAFQTKHLSADDKKAIEAEQKQKAEEEKKAAELKAREEARIEAEKKEKELNIFIKKIESCKSVAELVEAKNTIPKWVLDTPEFIKAATTTQAKVLPKKETKPEPVAA